MADMWTTHHEGNIGDRPVEVKTHSEGGYRVSTTQAQHDPGSVSIDGSSTAIITPTDEGRPIDIDGETIDEVKEGLADEGFSPEQIAEIVGHFPK